MVYNDMRVIGLEKGMESNKETWGQESMDRSTPQVRKSTEIQMLFVCDCESEREVS